MTDMRFVKQSFLGIELDILVGHPEHRILFIATQVARAAGLKDASKSARQFRDNSETEVGIQVRRLIGAKEDNSSCLNPDEALAVLAVPRWRDIWLYAEHEAYQMLLRGHAPQSEPFRKWVTEEVIPAIVEKGSYNVNDSETKEALQFSGELAQLHQVITELKASQERLTAQNEVLGFAWKPSRRPLSESKCQHQLSP